MTGQTPGRRTSVRPASGVSQQEQRRSGEREEQVLDHVGAVEVVVGNVGQGPALRERNEEQAAGEAELLAQRRGGLARLDEARAEQPQGRPVGGRKGDDLEDDLRVRMEGPR